MRANGRVKNTKVRHIDASAFQKAICYVAVVATCPVTTTVDAALNN